MLEYVQEMIEQGVTQEEIDFYVDYYFGSRNNVYGKVCSVSSF